MRRLNTLYLIQAIFAGVVQAAPAEVDEWMKANAIPLNTVQAGNGFKDLQPVKTIIGNARIVSLGEATHGTREFFQLKHRIVEFLASELNFTIFAIEYNMPEAYRINEYVLTGKGDPAAILRGLWHVDTKEFLDLIEWMRVFNQSGKGRIEFMGFDMQAPLPAMKIAHEFIGRYDADYLSDADKSPPERMLDHLKSSRARYLAAGASAKDADWAIQNARIVLQAAQMKSNIVVRERAMADNIKWLLDQSPQAKMIVWAHNGHVRTQPYLDGIRPMGAELRTMLGDQMRVFGFAFNRGSFLAVEQSSKIRRSFAVSAPPLDSFDAILAATGLPLFALDLRSAPADSDAELWLRSPHKSRSIGASYAADRDAEFFNWIIPREVFDSILFVETTTAAVPNPAAPPPTPAVDCDGQNCTDKLFQVSFHLPKGWNIKNSSRSPDRQNTIVFTDPQAVPGENPSLYYQFQARSLKRTSEELLDQHRQASEAKVRSRRQAFPEYHMRKGSCHARSIHGAGAWTCIADFIGPNQLPTAEYLTWVGGENANALFFGFIPANELDAYIARFEAVIETLELP